MPLSNQMDLQKDQSSANYISFNIGQQLFGILVDDIEDVIRSQGITPIPLAPKEIIGAFNLRGRIVNVIDIKHILQVKDGGENANYMYIVFEIEDRLYAIPVNNVSEVMTISNSAISKNPENLSEDWKKYTSGIRMLKGELMIILNIRNFINNIEE